MNKGLNSGVSGPNNGPKAIAYNSVAQSLATSTFAVILLDVVEYDRGHMTTLVKVTGEILIPKDGWYDLKGQVGYAANGTGIRVAEIFVTHPDGGTNQYADGSGPASAAAITGVVAFTSLFLRKGAKVKVRGWQNSGGALNNAGGFLSVTYVGAG